MFSRLLPGKNLSETPKAFAFGVFVWVALWGSFVQAGCLATRVDETVRLGHIIDGDTLRLQDGRRIRVLGINTPEVARKGLSGQALGAEATTASRQFLPKEQVLHLVYDRERKDRYGRELAHVYNAQRQNLAAHLLEQGLALQVVVPPNISGMDCLAQQEAVARQKKRGVWREAEWRLRSAADLDLTHTGFSRIKGKVTKVSVKRDVWLELDGPVVIRIAQGDLKYFDDQQWQSWLGKSVEVRGWLINRASELQRKRGFKPLQLQVRHPLMFEKSPRKQ